MKLHWMCNGYKVHTLKAWKFELLDLNPQTYILFSWNSIENIIFKYSLDASSPTRCCWGCARRTLKHRWKESFNQSCDFTYENLGVRLVVTYLLKTLFKNFLFKNYCKKVILVTQNMMRTHEGKSSFRRKKNPICDYYRSNQMP